MNHGSNHAEKTASDREEGHDETPEEPSDELAMDVIQLEEVVAFSKELRFIIFVAEPSGIVGVVKCEDAEVHNQGDLDCEARYDAREITAYSGGARPRDVILS